MNQIQSVAKLIAQFASLPGVGNKTAQRYALAVLNMSVEQVKTFSEALIEAKTNVKFCQVCGSLTDSDTCTVCKSRSHDVICVVKDAKDVMAMEKVRDFRGVYHVLNGVLNPIEGIGPNQLNIKKLLTRITSETKEVIVATNPDVEGEATAMYIARLLKPLNVKVTRLAQGIAIGSDIEYIDEVTLSRALDNRKEI